MPNQLSPLSQRMLHIVSLHFCCLPERLHSAVPTGTKLELLERALGLALLLIPTATGVMMGIAACFSAIRMLMTAFEPCSDMYYPVNVLCQSCVKVCIVRAFFVGLMCCEVCKQLDSCVLIQISLRCQAGCQYASDALHHREGGV